MNCVESEYKHSHELAIYVFNVPENLSGLRGNNAFQSNILTKFHQNILDRKIYCPTYSEINMFFKIMEWMSICCHVKRTLAIHLGLFFFIYCCAFRKFNQNKRVH